MGKCVSSNLLIHSEVKSMTFFFNDNELKANLIGSCRMFKLFYLNKYTDIMFTLLDLTAHATENWPLNDPLCSSVLFVLDYWKPWIFLAKMCSFIFAWVVISSLLYPLAHNKHANRSSLWAVHAGEVEAEDPIFFWSEK